MSVERRKEKEIEIPVLGQDKPFMGKEDDLQINCINYLRYQYPKKLFFHVPNGGARNSKEGAKFKRMGVRAGVSDILFLEPNDIFSGLIIELKTKDGKTTPSQKDFLKAAVKRGYKCVIAYNIESFIDTVKWYFKN